MHESYIWFYTITVWIILIFYQKRIGYLAPSSIAIFLYALASIMTLIFFYSPYGQRYSNITLFPFIYLISTTIILYYPVLKWDGRKVKIIRSEDTIIYAISILISLVSIIPFLEYVFLARKSVGIGMDYTAMVHDLRNTDNVKNSFLSVSPITSICYSIITRLSDLIPLVLCYVLTIKIKHKKLLILGMSLSILTILLNAYVMSTRSDMVYYSAYLLFCVLLFKPFINKNLFKTIKKVGYILIITAISGLAIITWVRYLSHVQSDSRGLSVLDWISLYAGEGPINFNEHVWNMKTTMKGDMTAPYFKYLLGLDNFYGDNIARRSYWSMKTGIPQNVFYTSVGNFVEDYGKVGALTIIILLSLLIRKKTKETQVMPLHRLFLLGVWFRIIAFSFMFFSYGSARGTLLFTDIIIYSFLVVIENKSLSTRPHNIWDYS